MKTAMISIALALVLSSLPATAQPGRGGGGSRIGALQTNSVEDFKPSASVQQGSQYPQVNSEHRVRARVRAPQAQNVYLDIGATKYPLTKGENGVWIGDSAPHRTRDFITISSRLMAPRFPTLAVSISMAPAAGAAEWKFRPMTRTFMP
jgi:hypothetical protein